MAMSVPSRAPRRIGPAARAAVAEFPVQPSYFRPVLSA
jgi:hypothetical protein